MRLQLQKKTNNGGGDLDMLVTPKKNGRFGVKYLTAKVSVVFLNGNAMAQTVLAESFCHASRINVRLRDGTEIVKDMPWLFMEWYAQLMIRGYFTEPQQCVNAAIAGSGAGTTTVDFYIDIPIAIPLGARLADWQQSLSRIGVVTVKAGATGNANVTVDSFTVTLVADGERLNHYAAGAIQKVKWAPLSMLTEDTIPIHGERLLSLLAVTKEVATPLNGTSPRVQLDGDGPILLDTPDVDVTQQGYFQPQPYYGAFERPGTASASRCSPLVMPGSHFHLGDKAKADQVNVQYGSISGTANKQAYVVHTCQAQRGKCVRSIPGADKLTAAEFRERFSSQPKLGGESDASPELAAFLPIQVYTPEAVGSECGQANNSD